MDSVFTDGAQPTMHADLDDRWPGVHQPPHVCSGVVGCNGELLGRPHRCHHRLFPVVGRTRDDVGIREHATHAPGIRIAFQNPRRNAGCNSLTTGEHSILNRGEAMELSAVDHHLDNMTARCDKSALRAPSCVTQEPIRYPSHARTAAATGDGSRSHGRSSDPTRSSRPRTPSPQPAGRGGRRSGTGLASVPT